MKSKLNNLSIILIASFSFLQMECKEAPPVVPPVIPPDSTSQEFVVTVHEIGMDSVFQYSNGICVFDASNIWIVGNFFLRDKAAAGGIRESNIIRWNGTTWYQYERIFNSSGFSSLFGLDSNTIFFSSIAVRKYHYGTITPLLFNIPVSNDEGIYETWGSAHNHLFGVGVNGMAGFHNGFEWKRLNFPKGWNFGEIIGSNMTGNAYANVTDFTNGGRKYIAELKQDSIYLIYKFEEGGSVRDIFLINDTTLLIVGQYIKILNINTGKDSTVHYLGNRVPVAGAFQSENDYMFFTKELNSSELHAYHYNGKRFTEISFPSTIQSASIYDGHAKKNLFAFTGNSNKWKSVVVTFSRSHNN